MIERFRHHIALRPLLQVVVADLKRSIDRFLYVAILKRVELLVVVSRPHACEIISLKLQPHTYLVCLSLAQSAHLCVCLVEYAELILHGVSYLMRYHVCESEITVSTDGLAHIAQKR